MSNVAYEHKYTFFKVCLSYYTHFGTIVNEYITGKKERETRENSLKKNEKEMMRRSETGKQINRTGCERRSRARSNDSRVNASVPDIILVGAGHMVK